MTTAAARTARKKMTLRDAARQFVKYPSPG